MKVDFGTYHHSTAEESRNTRDMVEKSFNAILPSLCPSDSSLEVLDAGCGLGFLTYVVSKIFPNARITGVDIFSHDSLSGATIEKARENISEIGIDSRTTFLEHDLRKPLDMGINFDMAVSSLVFHNLGKGRFKGYETVFSALKKGGYFILGDLFPHMAEDLKYFRGLSEIISEDVKGRGKWAYRIKVMKKL